MLSSLPEHIFVLGTLCHWVGEKCYVAHRQVLFSFILFFPKDSVINYQPDVFFPFFSRGSVNSSWETISFSLLLSISPLFYYLVQFYSGWGLQHWVSLHPFKNIILFSRQLKKEWQCADSWEGCREINNICETPTWTLKIVWTEVKKLWFPKALVRGLESPAPLFVLVRILIGSIIWKNKPVVLWKLFFFSL